ncbi:hypothetical protein AB8989_21045 [Yersinia hibernica]|uniref:Lipoprotein n=1 Tax=Yersinia hibernica TaxID=2339259 RepID=A0ABX5R2M7_9GAMM|nr:hypothetical protein [Yersinia hibernica]QAX79777.1 hypothetical protein D5F51_15190 [Yersinia hibernica]
MQRFKYVRALLSLLGGMLLLGCGNITHKYYNTDITYKKYNETKHEFSPLPNTSGGAMLVIRYNSQFTFWVNHGRTYRSVGGMGWVSQKNYKDNMILFEDFIAWANSSAELRESKRSELNNSSLFKDKEIAFGYFKDGTPAFIDKYDGNMAFERLYLPSIYAYYSKESIAELLTTSRIALNKIK